jgi:hypothetical protein
MNYFYTRDESNFVVWRFLKMNFFCRRKGQDFAVLEVS